MYTQRGSEARRPPSPQILPTKQYSPPQTAHFREARAQGAAGTPPAPQREAEASALETCRPLDSLSQVTTPLVTLLPSLATPSRMCPQCLSGGQPFWKMITHPFIYKDFRSFQKTSKGAPGQRTPDEGHLMQMPLGPLAIPSWTPAPAHASLLQAGS